MRNRDHGVEILRIHRDTFRLVRDPSIARRAIDLCDSRRLPKLPHQSVLASTTTNDENLHSRDIQG